MKIQKDYSLEQLTAESVNVVEISIATINKKPHETRSPTRSAEAVWRMSTHPRGASSSRKHFPRNMLRRCWRCGVKIPRYPIRPLKEAE